MALRRSDDFQHHQVQLPELKVHYVREESGTPARPLARLARVLVGLALGHRPTGPNLMPRHWLDRAGGPGDTVDHSSRRGRWMVRACGRGGVV